MSLSEKQVTKYLAACDFSFSRLVLFLRIEDEILVLADTAQQIQRRTKAIGKRLFSPYAKGFEKTRKQFLSARRYTETGNEESHE